jgi:hypothetical protein
LGHLKSGRLFTENERSGLVNVRYCKPPTRLL